MAFSSNQINVFELAIILAKASRAPEELASNIDLTKLTRLINAHFAQEAPNYARIKGTNCTGPGA